MPAQCRIPSGEGHLRRALNTVAGEKTRRQWRGGGVVSLWQWQYTLARPEKGNIAQDEVGKKRLGGKEKEDNTLSCH